MTARWRKWKENDRLKLRSFWLAIPIPISNLQYDRSDRSDHQKWSRSWSRSKSIAIGPNPAHCQIIRNYPVGRDDYPKIIRLRGMGNKWQLKLFSCIPSGSKLITDVLTPNFVKLIIVIMLLVWKHLQNNILTKWHWQELHDFRKLEFFTHQKQEYGCWLTLWSHGQPRVFFTLGSSEPA